VEKASYPVSALCRALGVSRQAYYAFSKRGISPRVERELRLQEHLRRLHGESRGTYGSPRLHAALRREGHHVGKHQVERALRSMGLRAQQRRRWRTTTCADHSHAVAPNTLARDFSAQRPNERWVTDITYVFTHEGWVYLAAILDLYSRAVVGWAIDTSMTTALPVAALQQALRRRRPTEGLLHHSDRGSQYTSQEYRQLLREHGIEASMSRKGNCWDNAVAESFFATLKKELVHSRRWRNALELRDALFDYIDGFYNTRRFHSSLAFRAPMEAEKQYLAALAA
jgi:transposase InsO family protein